MKELLEVLNHSRFEVVLQSHSNKNNVVLAQSRHIDEWNKIKDPNMNTHTFSHLTFDKGAKNTCYGKEITFNKWFLSLLLMLMTAYIYLGYIGDFAMVKINKPHLGFNFDCLTH